MDVSILKAPGATRARRSSHSLLLAVVVCIALGWTADASAFSLVRFSSGASVQLDPNDILQGGATLGPGSDQNFGQGTFPAELTDFTQPLDINLTGVLGGNSLSTRLFSNFAFAIVLTNAERNQCLNDSDFQIDLGVTTPSGSLESGQLNGGELQVTSFNPIYRGAWGRRCPSVMFYGFSLDLAMELAVASGNYSGASEINVTRIGGGGQTEAVQITLQVGMPSLMLLYHPDRVDINLRAVAIAGLLGASTACGTDGCLDLGQRQLNVTSMGAPLPVNVQGAAPAFDVVQTVTLQNAVAVRATGCSGNTYTNASYQIVSTSGGIQPGSGNIPGLVGASCGLDFRYGDLSFDLDLAQATSANATATIEITVTGI